MDQQGECLEHVINVISSEISTHTQYLIPEFVHEHRVPAYLLLRGFSRKYQPKIALWGRISARWAFIMEYNNPAQQYYQGMDDKAENTAPSKQL